MSREEELHLDPASEITKDNVYKDPDTNTFQFEDAAALKLVLDDADRADNYLNQNNWAAGWTFADTIYQSPQSQSAFDGGNASQSNVPKYTLSNHLSSITPRILEGIFYEDPPFLLRPRPGTTQDIVRQKTALFAAQLEMMDFEEECERAIDQMALLGTCIMKWGFTQYTVTEKKFVRVGNKLSVTTPVGTEEVDTPESDDYTVEYVDKVVAHPWIKYTDMRNVLVDTGCRYGDVRRAGHVVYRDFPTFTDLDRLRGVEGYDIPDESTLKQFFLKDPSTGSDNITLTIPEGMRAWIQHAVPRNYKSTSDPFQNGLEVLERWDKEKVIVALCINGYSILIRNEPNPYGKIPFFSANWRNIPDCFYGQGLGILIGSEQLVEQGITNLALDLLAYGLQPTAVRKKGFNTPTQTIRWKQGGIIDVDEDVDKAFKFLTMPPVPAEAWQFIGQSKSDSAATSGANEQVIQGAGGLGNHSTGMRSGTGAAAVIQANASRLDGPDGRFIRQIFEPWIYQMDELNNQYLPTSTMKQILGEELGQEYIKSFDHIQFRNAKLEYEVLAGAHLGARKEMAQFLPIMLQIFNNPTFTADLNDAGYEWDAKNIFNEFATAAGWKFSQNFLKPMTPERKAMHDANKPAALQQKQIQAQQAMQLQKFQQEEVLENEKQLGKAGSEVLRQSVEHALQSEEVNGVPGNTGFGSTTAI